MMKFGLFGINMGPCSDPVTALRVAQAAEAAGFESVWTGEHIVLPDPDPQAPASPVPHGIGHRSRRRLAQHGLIREAAAAEQGLTLPRSSRARGARRSPGRRGNAARLYPHHRRHTVALARR